MIRYLGKPPVSRIGTWHAKSRIRGRKYFILTQARVRMNIENASPEERSAWLALISESTPFHQTQSDAESGEPSHGARGNTVTQTASLLGRTGIRSYDESLTRACVL